MPVAVEVVAPAADTPATAAGAASHMRMHVVWMTCVGDGREHAVTEDNACLGLTLGAGTYEAVCARTVAPQSMTASPGPRCAACCWVLREWTGVPRRIGRWRRWLARVAPKG